MQDLLSILKQYWGYEEFRPLQAEIIQSVVNGKDTLALMPTGGGKSVCYQVPALAQNGLCLVISPLIALMKDQVENLKKKGVMALAIYSGQSRRQIVQTLKNAAYGDYKLLYISPERLETQLFKEYLPALGVNLIAVDEAHCISQWGYDFRPSYLKIQELRKELPNVPVLALTASATKEVQEDICNKLGFKEINIYRQSYERKNLSYSVFKVDAKIAKLVDIASKVPGTGIVYCKSRKRTVEIANLLQMHGLSAQYYHAGLQPEDRSNRQQEWIDGKVKIMVCTNAFGMGIDKPDVRLVIHADIPDCLENYYQEAGRAGRDGKKSYAVLLADEQDATELQLLHKSRYPDFDRIKKVYEGLVNFLQVPSHYGENISYSFRFDEFIRNFKLQSTETLYALKALEADGWIFFNEKSFTPASVVFNTSKQQLNDVFSAYPSFEPLITILLRNYEGIFDYPAYISESLLGKLLRKSEEEIKKGLIEISSLNIIWYTSQNENPQIIFRENRPAVQDLTLNLTEYNKRKAAFIDRVEQIVQYTKIKTCRSGFINEYFGDATPPCGVCDNCLALKNIEVSHEEFKSITTLIEQVLAEKELAVEELIIAIKSVKKEKAWKVINFLQAEKKILVQKNGLLQLSNKKEFNN
jgi:ATP-dependent DNA helicase RecQ